MPNRHIYDFVVVGGGLAGICCAIAASRQGVKTALINDRPVLGGNSSSEIRVAPNGSAQFNAWTMETGIIEEILLKDRAQNHCQFTCTGTVNSMYDLNLYNFVMKEENLDLFLNTSVRTVETETINNNSSIYGKSIKRVHASQQGSEKELTFIADQYADCTGDGTVGYLAGAEFRYGREARSEHNENLAPVEADDQVMGSTISILARDTGKSAPFIPPDWIKEYKTEEDIGLCRNVGGLNGEQYSGFWWLELSNPYHTIDDSDEIRDELLSHLLGVWNYIKNYSENKEQASNYAIEWIGKLPGKRESRRLIGDVIVSEKNCRQSRKWPDRVCRSGWF